MKTILSWVVANIATFIRLVTLIVLIILFSRTDIGIIAAIMILIPYFILSHIWGRFSATNGGMGFLAFLIMVGLYYFLIIRAGSFFGVEPSSFSHLGAPLISLGVGLFVAIFAVANFDEVTSCAFLWNTSAVEQFDTQISYFFNRLGETIIQLLFSFAAYELIRQFSISIANS